MASRFTFLQTNQPVPGFGINCWRLEGNSACWRAAWARATRCGSRESFRCTDTRSRTPLMCGKRVWIGSSRWRSRIYWQRRTGKGEGGGRKEDPGRARNGGTRHRARRLQRSGRSGGGDRIRDERVSGSVPEEEYCPGVFAAAACRDWFNGEGRDPRTKCEGASGADAVL